MSEEKKYPRAIVGAFIFNDKDELFMMRCPQYKGKYTVPGGKIELNETIEKACAREVKEETNITLKDIELMGVTEGLKLDKIYTKPEKHLIFMDCKAKVKDANKIVLNEEGTKYKWLPVSEWLRHKDLAVTAKKSIEKFLLDTDDFEHKYKIALADYQNLLKRTSDEKQQFAKYANEQLIIDMIPVYDNLKVSMEHIDEAAKTSGWAEGIKYVIKQFSDVLNGLGVEELEATGKKFDPNTMDALEGKGDKVKKTVKSGYRLRDKVIMPAKVILE